MRDLLGDLLRDVGLTPLGQDETAPGDPADMALVVVSLDRLSERQLAPWLGAPGDTPVLALQGYGEAERLPAQALGPRVTVLRKPFAIAEFVDMARRLAFPEQ